MPAHRTFFLHFGRRMGLTRKPARVPNDVSLGLSWVPRPGLTCLAALLGPMAASGISFSPFWGVPGYLFLLFLALQIMVTCISFCTFSSLDPDTLLLYSQASRRYGASSKCAPGGPPRKAPPSCSMANNIKAASIVHFSSVYIYIYMPERFR